jgi:uncharacterized protein (TIGR00369 family)
MTGNPNVAAERGRPSAFQQHMGYVLEVWEPERAVLGYTIQAEHMNRTGRLHGGVLATLLDTTMGYSGVYSDEPGGTRACVTLSLTVNFVGAVSEGRLTIEARRTGGGNTIFFSEGEVRDAQGRLVATATGSFRYISRRPEPG